MENVWACRTPGFSPAAVALKSQPSARMQGGISEISLSTVFQHSLPSASLGLSRMQWLVSTKKPVEPASKVCNHQDCKLGFLGDRLGDEVLCAGDCWGVLSQTAP